jgi:hypothetical protein
MAKETRAPALERTLSRLLDSRSQTDGHRILLEAALSFTGARAAALWARAARGWNPLLAAGEAELLPEERRVRALLEDGAASAGLRAGEFLLAPEGRSLALLLAGSAAEARLDELEALLLVHESTLDPRRIEAAPLPRPEEPGLRSE